MTSVSVAAFLVIVACVTAVHVAFTARVGAVPGGGGRARAIGIAIAVLVLWLGGTALFARTGMLSDFSGRPPLALRFFATTLLVTALIAASPLGDRVARIVPLAWLVGASSFRVPLELLLHRLHREGVVPIQMTYEGRNFDIVSGLGAIVVALLLVRGRASRRLVLAWNVVSLALLVNIVGTAALSVPGPMRVFMNEPANTFVTHAPFVWLPTFLVATALFLHLLVFRAWRSARIRRPEAIGPD